MAARGVRKDANLYYNQKCTAIAINFLEKRAIAL